jgi:hypothetical protein
VMQCAGTKRSGGYLRSASGRRILFVGRPDLAPRAVDCEHAHPDDRSDVGSSTWRDVVVSYNNDQSNPERLWRAFELYAPPAAPTIYRSLVNRFGIESVFILSAGWGLIRADFLTPQYDITFAPEAKAKAPWKHRGRGDEYRDLCHLDQTTTSPIVFVGGNSYLPLFCRLTAGIRKRTIMYNSGVPPKAPGCNVERFVGKRRMNWQYDCAEWLLSNDFTTRGTEA